MAFVLLAASVVLGESQALDTRVELAMHSMATPILDIAMEALTLLGTIPVVVAVVLASGGLLVRARRRFEAVALTALMLGQGGLDDLLKLAIHRPRPQLFPHAVAHGFSFPSGHAMTTLTLAGALAFLAWPRLPALLRGAVGVVAVAIVAGVGASRVYLGVHYPTDVLGGWLAGIAWLAGFPRLSQAGAALAAVTTNDAESGPSASEPAL